MQTIQQIAGLVLGLAISIGSLAQINPNWDPDYDGDNQIGVTDLLGLLGVFEEQDADDDGIFDSQDDCMGIVHPCGVCNGTGTDLDLDGLCDTEDDCVGDYDECGVCNGPGPDWPVVDTIVVTYDSIYIEPIEEWYVYELYSDTTFTFVCAPSGCTDPYADNYDSDAVIDDGSCTYGPAECGSISTISFDGYAYDLIAIGNQCWFKENLRSASYSNGELIQGGVTETEWQNLTTGAQGIYGGESFAGCYTEPCDTIANLSTYGRLYNWYAVADARGICPVGWHIPEVWEWWDLIDYLGGSEVAGNHMKAKAEDAPSWNGSNTSGFSALASGHRHWQGGYFDIGGLAFFWSSTFSSPGASFVMLYEGAANADISSSEPVNGYAVRCVKDQNGRLAESTVLTLSKKLAQTWSSVPRSRCTTACHNGRPSDLPKRLSPKMLYLCCTHRPS